MRENLLVRNPFSKAERDEKWQGDDEHDEPDRNPETKILLGGVIDTVDEAPVVFVPRSGVENVGRKLGFELGHSDEA